MPRGVTASGSRAAANSDPGKCQYCNRQMRRVRQRLEDFPGSITMGRVGICVTCCQTWTKYGLHPDDWVRMLIEQSGRCAVCLDPMRQPVVDHDHTTGRVRALLCQHCNAAEGLLLGNPAKARALADYMEHHSNVNVY
jgi:hypothetical protein